MAFFSHVRKAMDSRNGKLVILAMVLAAVLAWAHISPAGGGLVVEAMDVGQGDAILITTPHGRRVLIDGGPGQSVLRELGATMPFLSRKIDVMALTNPHADHVDGLVPVIRRYDVGQLMVTGVTYPNAAYTALLKSARAPSLYGYPYLTLADDDRDFVLDGVTFDILYPFEPLLGDTISNVNNSSVVIMVRYGDHRILLTGDAEIEEEAELVEAHDRGEIDLHADVLKAGHHGSRTSSTPEFLERVNPEVAIISSGEGNSYDHPHPETLDAFNNLDLTVRRTDREGRVRLEFR